jgi:hypothetical protein
VVGPDYKIPLPDLLAAAKQHADGWSLRALARMNWKRWGYASDKAALEGLRKALRQIDAPVRDRIAATVLASTFHGYSTRTAIRPGSSLHAQYLSHLRWQRQQQKITADAV